MARLQFVVALVSLLCVWESHSEKVTNQSPSAMDSSQQMTVEDRNSRWDVEKNELNKVDTCLTDHGSRCKHKFTYSGKDYYQCTTAGASSPWCYTEDGSYGWCTNCEHHIQCPWRCDVCPNRWDGPCTQWCSHDEVWGGYGMCGNTGEHSNKGTDCSKCKANVGVKNEGQDCWGGCKGRQGRCQQFCGDGLCCRYGWGDTSGGCDGTVGIPGKGHVCAAANFKEKSKERQDEIEKNWCCQQLSNNPNFTPSEDDKKQGRGPTGDQLGNRIWGERNCFDRVGGPSKSKCN